MTEQSRWWDAHELEDPTLPSLSDHDILGVPDGYDDYKIDTVFEAYIMLRRKYKEATDRPWQTA